MNGRGSRTINPEPAGSAGNRFVYVVTSDPPGVNASFVEDVFSSKEEAEELADGISFSRVQRFSL